LIKNSVVFQQFKALGYKTIAFETGYDFTQIKNADLYLEPVKPSAFFGSIDPYEVLLLKSSIFKIIYDTHIPVVNQIFDQLTFPYTNHVQLQRFMFENLIKISGDLEPTFTFVHLTVPHTPFVFRADGSYTKDRRYFSGAFVTPISNELFVDGYLNQLQYVNTQILDTVQKILENSKTPPIIILQGDHGAIMEHRLPILNAYLVPNSIKDRYYSSISPVNSFRLIFQNVFGLNYPLLEDKSYYSKYETLFEWTLEPEKMDRCIK
ncbi:MAG: sulfatase-like hydrolase/transferase, partial [Dehalobacter sp.]|nr:sulfatase-like hydrolase/transferase [Dehalobacter sp.]